MKYKVVVTNRAMDDLDIIFNNVLIFTESKLIAEDKLSRLLEKAFSLEKFPKRYPQISINLDSIPIRKMSVQSYLIFYTVIDENNHVVIERIISSKSDYYKLFNENDPGIY